MNANRCAGLFRVIFLSAGVLVVNAALAQTKYTFAVDHAAVAANGNPLFLDDAKVAAAVAELAHVGARIDTCRVGAAFPNLLDVTYAPTLTGPHTAKANRLACEFDGEEKLVCRTSGSDDVAFDQDASQFFRLGKATELDDALQIFRAYRSSEIHFPEKMKFPNVRDSKIVDISRQEKYFIISTADCGCGERLEVERRTAGNTSSVVAVKVLSSICI